MRLVGKVERLLQKRQEYRDSDKQLLLGIWASEGLHLNNEQRAAFMGCTAAETITRARRALKHKYPASPDVEEARFKKFVQYKRVMDWRA